MSDTLQLVSAIAGSSLFSGGLGAVLTYKGNSKSGEVKARNKFNKQILTRLDGVEYNNRQLQNRVETLEKEATINRLQLERAVTYLRRVLEKAMPAVGMWGPVPPPPEELTHKLDDLIRVM